MIIIIVFTAILNMFYTQGARAGEALEVPDHGRRHRTCGADGAARIIMLITGTFLLTYTTSPITLTDGLERLMGPLKKIHSAGA